MTRRKWTALVTTVPLAAQVTNSSKPPQASPMTPADTPEQKLQKAYQSVRDVSSRLSKIELPMTVEPAFSFKA